MTGVELIAVFINMLVSCSAMPMYETRIGGHDYQIQAWACQTSQGPLVVKTWRGTCSSGHVQYWGHSYYMLIEGLNVGIQQNRFGETHIGEGAGVQDAYTPECGS